MIETLTHSMVADVMSFSGRHEYNHFLLKLIQYMKGNAYFKIPLEISLIFV